MINNKVQTQKSQLEILGTSCTSKTKKKGLIYADEGHDMEYEAKGRGAHARREGPPQPGAGEQETSDGKKSSKNREMERVERDLDDTR